MSTVQDDAAVWDVTVSTLTEMLANGSDIESIALGVLSRINVAGFRVVRSQVADEFERLSDAALVCSFCLSFECTNQCTDAHDAGWHAESSAGRFESCPMCAPKG